MDTSGRGARILLKFTGQLNVFYLCVCLYLWPVEWFYFKLWLLFERTLFPAHYITTLARDVTRSPARRFIQAVQVWLIYENEMPILPSFHPILHLYFVCVVLHWPIWLLDFFYMPKVWVLCQGSTAGKRLRRFFARTSFALLVLWKQRDICIK